jgi:hypothetical protein
MNIKDVAQTDICPIFNQPILQLTDGMFGVKCLSKPYIILFDPMFGSRKRDGKSFRKEHAWIAKLVKTNVDNSDNTKSLNFDTEDMLVLTSKMEMVPSDKRVIETNVSLERFLVLSEALITLN